MALTRNDRRALSRGGRAVRRGVNREPRVQRGEGPGTPDGWALPVRVRHEGRGDPLGSSRTRGWSSRCGAAAQGPTLRTA